MAIGRGVAWSTIGVSAGKVFAIANIFIVLSQLTVYDYGLVELVMSTIAIGSLFMLSGLGSVVAVDLGVERRRNEWGKMKSIFLQYLTLHASLGVVVACAFFTAAPFIATYVGNPVIEPFLKIAGAAFLIAPLRAASTILASANVRFVDQALYGVVEELWKTVLLVGFLVFARLGPQELLIASVACQLCAVLTFAPRTYSAYKMFSHAPIRLADMAAFWQLLRDHRIWGTANTYVGTLMSNLRLWVIKAVLGTEAVGIFAFAYGILGNLASFLPMQSVLNSLYPHLAQDRARVARVAYTALRAQALLGIMLALGMSIFAYPFVHIFFPHFVEAIPLMLILSMVLIPSSMLGVITPAFAAYKEQKSLFNATLFKTCCTLVLLYPSILIFGVYGAGIEIVLTSLLTCIERLLRFKRLIPEFSLTSRPFFSLLAGERTIVRALMQRPNITRVKALLSEI